MASRSGLTRDQSAARSESRAIKYNREENIRQQELEIQRRREAGEMARLEASGFQRTQELSTTGRQALKRQRLVGEQSESLADKNNRFTRSENALNRELDVQRSTNQKESSLAATSAETDRFNTEFDYKRERDTLADSRLVDPETAAQRAEEDRLLNEDLVRAKISAYRRKGLKPGDDELSAF